MEDEYLNKFIELNQSDYEVFCDCKGVDYGSNDAKIDYMILRGKETPKEIKDSGIQKLEKSKEDEYNEFIANIKNPQYKYFYCSTCGDLTSKTHEYLTTKNKGTEEEYNIYYCVKCLAKTEIKS